MKLHKSTANGDYEVYPIYEIDYQYLSNLGITINETSDSLSNHNFKGRRITCINSNLRNGISTNIPLLETENGNIIPYWHRFRTQNNSKWYLDEENRASYSAIEQGVRPPDWGVNPNYIWLQTDYFNANGTRYFVYPRPVNISDSFSSSTSYYEDTKRTELKMFYTDTGCSFSVFKCSISRGSQNTMYARQYGAFGFPNYPSSWTMKPHYSMTTAENTTFGEMFANKIEVGITSEYSTVSYWQSFDSFQNGCNCPMFFVHYNDNGTDFYGVAIVQMSSFTGEQETCFPIAIRFTVLDSTFWGASIISGGESGAGEWGNKTIPTINDGTFSSTSNSVGTDNPNYSTTAIQTRVNTALSGLFSGLTGVYSIYLLDTADGQSISFTELTRIYNVLYASGNDKFLTRYLQSMYNPLSAVIAMHLLPYQFTASALFGVTVKKQLTISGYNVSTAISETTPPEYNILKPLGRVVFPSLDMPKYFGGFADFAPYTQCILHLPFIGAIELKTNAIAHGSITVEYLCDMISGNVTARISCTDNTGENTQYVHTASGNCAYNLPLFTMNQNGDAVGKLLSSGAGIVSGALTGNPVNVATGIAGVVGSAIESSFSPRSTQISGNMGGNNMLMSNLDIWLEIIRPVWVENMYYQKLNGIPADMSNCIADCGQDANAGIPYDGFLQIEKIDLDNVPCTEQEKQEIETLLKQGVFIRGSEI